MKNTFSPCPDRSLMKLSPESDTNPSRPYCRQVYIPEEKEVAGEGTKSSKKLAFKIGMSSAG